MKARLAFILALIVFGTGQPVFGQASREVETGSLVGKVRSARISDKIGLSDAERGRMAAAAFADCAVMRRKQDVAAFLVAPYSSRDSEQAMRKMAVSDCLSGGRLTMPARLMRGALFRAVYNRDYGPDDMALASEPPNYANLVSNPLNVDDATQILMLEFASCLIRTNRAEARNLLIAQVGSSKEKAAFSALVPLMGTCFPKGKSVELSKSVVTAVIAEAMYREAQAGSTGLVASSGKK